MRCQWQAGSPAKPIFAGAAIGDVTIAGTGCPFSRTNVETINELVVRARHGDVSACGRLVQAAERMVFAVALRILRDEALAEDAAQETYLRAFRRIADLKEDGAFLVWLRRIVVTVAIN